MVRTRDGGGARPRGRSDPAHAVSGSGQLAEVPAPHVLRDYALVADGRRGALIGPQGDCSWLCFPGWSDPAVFASLIGSGGHYTVRPEGRWVWGGSYVARSLVWTSRWVTTEGVVECEAALAYPGEPGRAVLLRRVRALDAAGAVAVVLDPRADYGRRSLGRWRQRDGAWEQRGSGLVVRLWGAEAARVAPDGPSGRLELGLPLTPGQHRDLVLELVLADQDHRGAGPPDADALWASTVAAWQADVPDCGELAATYDVRRAVAVLRGLTGPEGGTVAAATTSLPERARANRNYDYRYVWVRDTCYVGRAAAAVPGAESLLDGNVRWVTARLLDDGDTMVPAYHPDGTRVPGERQLDFEGYPGGTDVVGNHIRDQFQLDGFGEALQLLALAASRDRLDATGWEAAAVAAAAVERRWEEPDGGIWELEPRQWTQSRLACVSGLRALAGAGAPATWRVRHLALADAIAARVAADSVHPSGRWQRAPDDPRVDASLLLPEIRGAVAPGDPRSVATRRAVVDELSEDGYVYRYLHSGSTRPGQAEGAFLICNFWLSLACMAAGETADGVRWFERGRSAAGSPGLLAEEFDVAEHQLRGNLPQAFVHALLIEAAAAQEHGS